MLPAVDAANGRSPRRRPRSNCLRALGGTVSALNEFAFRDVGLFSRKPPHTSRREWSARPRNTVGKTVDRGARPDKCQRRPHVSGDSRGCTGRGRSSRGHVQIPEAQPVSQARQGPDSAHIFTSPLRGPAGQLRRLLDPTAHELLVDVVVLVDVEVVPLGSLRNDPDGGGCRCVLHRPLGRFVGHLRRSLTAIFSIAPAIVETSHVAGKRG